MLTFVNTDVSHQSGFLALAFLAVCLIPTATRGQEILARKPGESIEAFAGRIIPLPTVSSRLINKT